MKHIVLLLTILLSFAVEARPKKKVVVASFTPWEYHLDGFHAYRDTLNEALVTSDFPDGVQAPLPFRVIRGELSDLEFRETLIFIVDNLSEAYYD